jgi:hypothetical protein
MTSSSRPCVRQRSGGLVRARAGTARAFSSFGAHDRVDVEGARDKLLKGKHRRVRW